MARKKVTFADQLDTVMMISRPAREGEGEDSFYCAASENSAIAGVFDGCGGLGARKYDSLSGKTGAYMASRTVSGAVRDWFCANKDLRWRSADEFAASLDTYIRSAYTVCSAHAAETSKIMGSMVRKLPTTLALAYAEPGDVPDGSKGKTRDRKAPCIRVHILWAGDSRVYLLDKDGLAQLTIDDTDVHDAFENLLSDAPMNNVIAADGRYVINHRTLKLDGPALIIAATDGCFGYIPSPMEFEYAVVSKLAESSSPEEFRNELRDYFTENTGDDLAMGIISFGYGDFDKTRAAMKQRGEYLKKEYIRRLVQASDETYVRELWQNYRPGYERYLEATRDNNERDN